MLVGSVMTVKTFDVLDLVNMVAAQHEWDLWFDSGSGDDREVIFAKKGRSPKRSLWSSTSPVGSNGRSTDATASGSRGIT